MRQRLNRYGPRPAGPAIYWRRRVIALAVGMAVFGLVAWAVNGIFGMPATPRIATLTRTGGGHSVGTAAAGTAAASAGSASPSTSTHASLGGASGHPSQGGASGHPSQGASGHPSQGRGARHPSQGGASGHASQGPGQSGSGPGQGSASLQDCAPGDVVLTLHQRSASYSGGAWPAFTAQVVSIDPHPCTFRTSPQSVFVVVWGGHAMLWNSADCAGAAARTRAKVLTRGIPVVLRFWWDRKTGPPGCQGHRYQVRPGTYLATAVSRVATSNSVVFVLNGPGTATP